MGLLRFFRRRKWDRERQQELESYIQIETDENVARGMTPHAARQAALRKLGNATRIREEIYTMNTIGFLDALARDFRYAFRALRRRSTFTMAAVLTLALGIGANSTVFSVVNGVLIKPLPYPNADELVGIWHAGSGVTGEGIRLSPTMYFTYREQGRTFQSIGLWGQGGQSVTGVGEPEQVRAVFATYGVLHALGVQPIMGRWFSEEDEKVLSGSPEPVILSYGYWQRRFGGEASVIGRSMTVDSRPSQVVGVMPQSFRFPNFDPEIILVQHFDRARLITNINFGGGLARLKPGVTLSEANADVDRMLPIWRDGWPGIPSMRQTIDNWRLNAALRPLKNDVVGNVANMLWVIMATIGIVMFIACANVANLMLVRADGRRQEFAVRAALGAGRSRIAREVFAESFALGLMGGTLGLAFSYGALFLLRSMGPSNLPRLQDISIDPIVIAFTIAASLVSSVLFGAIPAIRHTSDIGSNLGAGSRGASVSGERQRVRNALVIVQVALALVLLVSSGLMIRSFLALRRVDSGFVRGEEIQTARIWIPATVIREPERFTRVQHDILDRIAAIPGVVSAAFAASVPMDGRVYNAPVFIEGRVYEAGQTPPLRRNKYVSPGYFQTMGTAMIAGRDITWTDIYSRTKVAVVSENFAREVWEQPAAAIGKRIDSREIVGVVKDVYEDGPHQKAPTTVYWPVLMETPNGLNGTAAIAYVIRSERAGTESLLSDVRQAVWSANSNLPVFLVSTMKELYDRALAQTSFTLVMLAIAGSMALALGLIGIYGVIAYAVSQRTREIGIRIALGAEHGDLKMMIVRHGLWLSGIGVIIGLAAAGVVTRFMSALLFGVSPLDPPTYAAVLVVLLTAAALASYIPARRAAAVDPVRSLKEE